MCILSLASSVYFRFEIFDFFRGPHPLSHLPKKTNEHSQTSTPKYDQLTQSHPLFHEAGTKDPRRQSFLDCYWL